MGVPNKFPFLKIVGGDFHQKFSCGPLRNHSCPQGTVEFLSRLDLKRRDEKRGCYYRERESQRDLTRKRDDEKKERDFSRVSLIGINRRRPVGFFFRKGEKKIVQRHLTTTLRREKLSEYVLVRTQKRCVTMGLLLASFVVRIKRGKEKEEISIGGFCSNGCGRR